MVMVRRPAVAPSHASASRKGGGEALKDNGVFILDKLDVKRLQNPDNISGV